MPVLKHANHPNPPQYYSVNLWPSNLQAKDPHNEYAYMPEKRKPDKPSSGVVSIHKDKKCELINERKKKGDEDYKE